MLSSGKNEFGDEDSNGVDVFLVVTKMLMPGQRMLLGNLGLHLIRIKLQD
jgi:hypothetical protein